MFTKSQHAAWHHVLGLCKLGEGETAIVLGAQGVDTRYREIALQVGRERGATAAYIEVENANRLPATALAALRAADFVVDLSHSHDPEIRKLAPHGTRTLVVLEPERSTEPEAVALLVGLRALKAVLTVPPATRRPDEKSPWPAAVPLAVMERLPRLITPPEAVMVMVGAVMVVAPATAVAPARVRVPGVEMLRLAGVAAAANQAGPVLVESAPARIEP